MPASTTEATTPESRHAWVIEVEPVTDAGRRRPDGRRRRPPPRPRPTPRSRTSRAARPGTRSPRPSRPTRRRRRRPATSAGSRRTTARLDEAFLKALFAAPSQHARPRSIEGADGIFRIGRVTEIAPQTVDAAYTAKLQDDGIDLGQVPGGRRRRRHPPEARRTRSSPTPPSPVRSARSARSTSRSRRPSPAADAVKVRHILYSPKDDPQRRGRRSRPTTRPGPPPRPRPRRPTRSSRPTRPCSTRSPGPRATRTGARRDRHRRQAPVLRRDAARSTRPSRRRSSKPGLQPGDILAPVKSAFGWHVIQVMYRPTDDAMARRASRRRPTAAPTSRRWPATTPRRRRPARGGDLGWVAKGQLDEHLIDGDLRDAGRQDQRRRGRSPATATYLFKVLAEETRTPEGRQLEEIKASAFSNWYTAKKARPSSSAIPADHGAAGGLSGATACSTRSSPRRDCAGARSRPRASRSSPPSG